MPFYTVHVPPDEGSRFAQAERTLVVPDTFSWAAFLFGPLWLLAKRLWLGLAVWVILAVGIVASLGALGASQGLVTTAFLLLETLVGFEGRQLLRGKYERRGFRPWDVLLAQNRNEAEHLFFTRWLAEKEAPAHAKAPVVQRAEPRPDDVIGMFPSSEVGR